MSDFEQGELHDSLSKILFKMELLEKKRQEIKKLSIIFTLFSLGAILCFILYTIHLTRKLDAGKILNETASSMQVRQAAQKNIHLAAEKIFPVIKKEFMTGIMQDSLIIRTLSDELKALIQSTEGTLSSELPKLYAELVEKQKVHLYEALPEFKNEPKVNQAIENIIKTGAPRLKTAFIKQFEEYKHSLLLIYALTGSLKDESMSRLPSLEKAVLGITLELFGKYLREEGEEGAVRHE